MRARALRLARAGPVGVARPAPQLCAPRLDFTTCRDELGLDPSEPVSVELMFQPSDVRSDLRFRLCRHGSSSSRVRAGGMEALLTLRFSRGGPAPSEVSHDDMRAVGCKLVRLSLGTGLT